MSPILYQITIHIPSHQAPVVDDLIAKHADSCSCFELDDDGNDFIVSAIKQSPWAIEKIKTELEIIFTALNWGEIPKIMAETITPKDWVSENQKSFEAISHETLVIESSGSVRDKKPYRHRLKIDAATAFGTGRHGSTLGCLQGLLALKKIGIKPKTIADIGTGTGILALASAKIWPNSTIIGTDIDPHSIMQGENNRHINNISRQNVRFSLCYGEHIFLPQHNIVLANILERPLFFLAKDLSQMVEKNGFLILSGFYTYQQYRLRNVFAGFNMLYHSGFVNQRWQTMILQKA